MQKNNSENTSFYFEDKQFTASKGDSIATALFKNNIRTNRKTHEKESCRGSYCFMGVCFECLVNVDGKSSIQGCKTKIEDAMEIKINDE